jgi:hypothetical protein
MVALNVEAFSLDKDPQEHRLLRICCFMIHLCSAEIQPDPPTGSLPLSVVIHTISAAPIFPPASTSSCKPKPKEKRPVEMSGPVSFNARRRGRGRI